MKYRRRPVEVEAVQYTQSNIEEIRELCGYDFALTPIEYRDDLEETAEVFDSLRSKWRGVKEGQWIIKEGERLYPLDQDIFETIWEVVSVYGH
jgi:hypothetical protein